MAWLVKERAATDTLCVIFLIPAQPVTVPYQLHLLLLLQVITHLDHEYPSTDFGRQTWTNE